MSIKVMTVVWERSRHAGTDLLMLLALADFSDDNGNSYPAVSTLASKCRMGVRNANYILKVLQASGELQVRANEGPKGTNRYRIVLDALGGLQSLAPLQAVAPLQASSSTPAMQFPKPLQPIADEPSLNRQEPSKKKRARKETLALDLSGLLPEVTPQVLTDWQQVRKAKRAGPITETVVKALRREAAKAGLSLQEAVETCCARGWQALNAEWLKPQKSFRERDAEAKAKEVRKWTSGLLDGTTDYRRGLPE